MVLSLDCNLVETLSLECVVKQASDKRVKAEAIKLEFNKHLLPKSLRKYLMKHAELYEKYMYWMQMRRLSAFAKYGKNFFKVPSTSLNYYQAQGSYEHTAYETGSSLCTLDGRIKKLSYKESRDLYCAYIFEEIDRLLSFQPRISILEVGCGNCINLVLIKKRYGDRVELQGLDVSGKRIETAKSYFGDALDGVSFKVQSITDPVPDGEVNKYDFVFSMHCIEQIPFAVCPAVEGMYKRAKSRVVLVEPVFDFARPSQKIFMIYSDFTRTLLPSIKYLGYKITRAEPLRIESSLTNQSSIIVVEK